MTAREHAILAIKEDRAEAIQCVEDVTGYRIAVFYRENGNEMVYESKPFWGETFQGFACECAKRLERLGLSRTEVKVWVSMNFKQGSVDLDLLFP